MRLKPMVSSREVAKKVPLLLGEGWGEGRTASITRSMGSLSAYVLMLKLTAMHPEEAVALTLKSASPNVLFAKALKVIVWLALAMLKVFTPALSA